VDTFKLDESLGYVVAKTNWYMKTYFGKLIKDHNLNITTEQWAVLNAIHSRPGRSQTEIAEISLKDKTNVTRILDILEKNGYIIRNQAKNDRRAYIINLTENGESVLKQLIAIANIANKNYINSLQNDEINSLITILKKISYSIEKDL
jgi:DNA-binding MarR family transcriptional regulator